MNISPLGGAILGLLTLLSACLSTNQGTEDGDAAATGGQSSPATGAAQSSGGVFDPNPPRTGGGMMLSGGRPGGGGEFSSGGQQSSGGVPSTGGSLVGGGSLGGNPASGGAVTTGGATVTECLPASAFSSACTADSECGFGPSKNCCLTVWTGVRKEELEAFAQSEALCRPQFDACGCFGDSYFVQDGSVEVHDVAAVGVRCAQGRCQTFRRDRACGDQICGPNQYCRIGVPGVPDLPPTLACQDFANGCDDCTCLGSQGDLPFCDCAERGDLSELRCYYP